jgi:hypothetical protein
LETQQPETLQPNNEELNLRDAVNELRIKAIRDCGVALTFITERLAKGSTVDHPLLSQVEKTIEMCKEYNHIAVSYCLPAEVIETEVSDDMPIEETDK